MKLILAAALIALFASNANAQSVAGAARTPNGFDVPILADEYGHQFDNEAFTSETPIVVGTAFIPARGIKAVCTAAGNFTVAYQNGSTGVWAVAVGQNIVFVSPTVITAQTATCTYTRLN